MQKVKINKLDLKCAKIMLNGFNHSKQYNELYIKQYWFQVDLTIIALILGYSIFIDIQSQIQQIVNNQIINYTINAIVAISLFICIELIYYWYLNSTISSININIFDVSQKDNAINTYPNAQYIIIPKQLDKITISNNKIFIFQKQQVSDQYRFLTIINRNDPLFDEQKFWQTHKLLLNEYFKGNLPLKPKSANTQKEA